MPAKRRLRYHPLLHGKCSSLYKNRRYEAFHRPWEHSIAPATERRKRQWSRKFLTWCFKGVEKGVGYRWHDFDQKGFTSSFLCFSPQVRSKTGADARRVKAVPCRIPSGVSHAPTSFDTGIRPALVSDRTAFRKGVRTPEKTSSPSRPLIQRGSRPQTHRFHH